VNDFYAIGDVARRTGLSVSAIRYYADEGIVAPSDHTDGGFRRYDVHAIAKLEVVRTLRDLGAGLEEIRRVLSEQLSLPELAETHLELVERQLGALRSRRAVLRTIVRQRTSTEQVSLMHKLVSMSDDDRDRIIDEFWDAVTEGLQVHPTYIERLHQMRPHLPEAPETEQLEAWIELADIVQDKEFRAKLRDHLHTSFGTEQTRQLATPEMLARIEKRRDLFLEAQAAQRAGMPTDSPQARDIAERMAADTAELAAAFTGKHDIDETRRKMIAFDRDEAAKIRSRLTGVTMLTRYLTLVATINGTVKPDPEGAAATQEWLAKTLKG
jgi:DNA-binding transcriptional MerR regulator